MKNRLSLLIALVAMFVVGCSQRENPVESTPVAPTVAKEIEFITMTDLLGNVEWDLTDKPVTVSATVTPANGGTLLYTKTGRDSYGNPTSVYWGLAIPPGAVAKRMTISMLVDYDTLSNSITTTLSPSPTSFLVPAVMNVNIVGIDTVKYGSATLGLFYINPVTRVWEQQYVPQGSIQVNCAQRQFIARNISIRHFSRYAFGR